MTTARQILVLLLLAMIDALAWTLLRLAFA